MREKVKLRCPHCDRALAPVSSEQASTRQPVHAYRKCAKCQRRWLFTRPTEFALWGSIETSQSIRSRKLQAGEVC